MSGRWIRHGSTDESTIVRILDAGDGSPEEAVAHDTPGLALWYRREGAAKVAITPAALASLDAAHADGGIEPVDDGYYRIDVPDAAFAAGASGVLIGGAVDGMVVIGTYHPLVGFDPHDAHQPRAGFVIETNGDLSVSVWLDQDGEPVDLSASTPAASCTVNVREQGEGMDLFPQLTSSTLNNDRFELTQPDAGFTADKLYVARVTVTFNGTTYTRDLELPSFGGNE